MSQSSPESGQRESAATDAPAAPDRNVIAQEPTSQAPMGGEVTLTPTPSTSIEPPPRGQPTEQVSQAIPESGQREPAAPDGNVIAKESMSQALQASTGGEIMVTPMPSNSTKPPSRGQPTKQVSLPHALTEAHFRFREEGSLVEVQGNKRARLQPEKLAVVPSNIAGTKRKALPTESQ